MARQIAFPFRFGLDGYISTTSDLTRQIRASVLAAVATRYGERMMNGSIGSRVPDLVFDPLGWTFEVDPAAFIEGEVRHAVTTLYPFVLVTSVGVAASSQQTGEYDVQINYTLDSSGAELTAAFSVNSDSQGS